MTGLTAWLATIASDLISRLGYGGLIFGLVVDSAGVPIPSEILIPLAGALARLGRFNFAVVVIVSTVAQTVGALLSYWLGASGGLALVKRYGKYVLFSERELAKTEAAFARWGGWMSFFGRCIPGVRTYIGFPAGLARMHLGRFAAASVTGSLAWSLLLASLGYYLSGRLDLIESIMHRFGLLVIGLLLVGAVWYLRNHRQKSTN